MTEREEQSVAEAGGGSPRRRRRPNDWSARPPERSERTVEAATLEAHLRVAQADAAVNELLDLRGRVDGQLTELLVHLDKVRELTGTAPGRILPLPDEADRPRTDDFPAAPAGRPVPVPGVEHWSTIAAGGSPADVEVVEAPVTDTPVTDTPVTA